MNAREIERMLKFDPDRLPAVDPFNVDPVTAYRGLRIAGAPRRYVERVMGLWPIAGGMPQGRLGHIGMGKEVTFGTPVAATRYFQFVNESLYTPIGEVTPPAVVGQFDEGPTFLGVREHKGKVRFNVFPDFFGMLLVAGWGVDTLVAAQAAPGLAAATTGGSLATGTIFVKTAPIFGRPGGAGIVANPASYIGVVGTSSAEASVAVTGPTASVTVTPAAVANATGFIVWYGTAAGAENLAMVTSGASLIITTTTVGGAVAATSAAGFAVTPGSAYNLHVFNPRQTTWGTNSAVQPLTFEVARDLGAANVWQYTGTVLEKLMWQISVMKGAHIDAKMLAEIDVIAKSYALITGTQQVFDPQIPFLFNQAKVSLNNAAYLTMATLKWDIDQGIEGKPYLNNSSEIAAIVSRAPRKVIVTGTMLADPAQWTNYVTRVQQALNIAFVGQALGAGNYQFMMDCPTFQYTAYPVGIAGPAEILVSFTGLAKYNYGDPTQPSIGSPARFALVNDVSAAY
jgi:hypothetical protein